MSNIYEAVNQARMLKYNKMRKLELAILVGEPTIIILVHTTDTGVVKRQALL